MANRSMTAKMERARAQRVDAGITASHAAFTRAGMTKAEMRAIAAHAAQLLADEKLRKAAMQTSLLKVGATREYRAPRVRANYASDDTGRVGGFEGYASTNCAAPARRSILKPDVYGTGSRLIKAGG